MSRVEERVFTDKLAALRYNREHHVEFFEATVPCGFVAMETSVVCEDVQKVYVVAVTLYRARVALVDYLMDVTKWSKKKQDEQYIAALEAQAESAV